jgi:uncharacterized cupin superfamily protein
VTATASTKGREKVRKELREVNIFDHLKDEAAKSDGWVAYDAAANGASNFVGEPRSEVRIDFAVGNILSAEYRQAPASFDIDWQFTEHAFVLEGEVTITDLDSGKTMTYGPGDGWTIRAGSRTRWEVKQAGFRKSGFVVTP